MPLSVSDRVSALENRQRQLEATVERLIEALNKCVTLDQVQQLEILNGTQIDALNSEVETLRAEVELLRAQIYTGI